MKQLQSLLITTNDSHGIRCNRGIHGGEDIRSTHGIRRGDDRSNHCIYRGDDRSNYGIHRGDDIRSNDYNYVAVACRSSSKLRHSC